ncbi:hypothetical protein L249_0276 [Ophiocordyceps polyrhachis-furcata BCC 54312]|uniref:Uncharacterized protein n=1 Tax=Ophiocordyceps polyrhachis-furcata BCC 54312 TaxID=1330021 RepID=A0A367LCZ6_9HYPO|nr:hypothetical protein L249_0276 [Ophiocordyceps polyrhachis-furcata BCC 54312]
MGRSKHTSGPKAPALRPDHEAPPPQATARYDMTLSRQRLQREGFHPAVTSKPYAEMLEIAGRMIQKNCTRPTREEYLRGQDSSDPDAFAPHYRLTRALLFFRQDLGQGGFDCEAKAAADKTGNGFCDSLTARTSEASSLSTSLPVATRRFSALQWPPLGPGTHCSLARQKVWDFYAGELYASGPAAAFIVVAPTYTVGEFSEQSSSGWFKCALGAEAAIYKSIAELHRLLKRRCKPEMGPLTDLLTDLARQLTDTKRIEDSSQFRSTVPSQVFNPQVLLCLMRLQWMVKNIFIRRSALRVLYFNKVPMLDRRMLAVILRACPLVEMVGVYNCPLIHFGDVICLLDLIHEVNGQRRKDGNPIISAFDFYPRYHRGMPFQHPRANTYGLTWGPDSRDVVQRGFFAIVLKAFMKAKALRLGLLFDKGMAFRDFLYTAPNYSLAVPVFLDALYRISDLRYENRTGKEDEFKQAMYDLVKPVRLGLELPDHDAERWYPKILGKYLVFCSSCGYEMLEEFFTAAVRSDAPPHRRLCAGCILSRRLDREDDHLKQRKMQVLNHLFPKHEAKCFNQDAPLGYEAAGLIRLKTREVERPPSPPVVVNADGHPYQPAYREALVRDNKVCLDSLQNLPSLGDIVQGEEFKTMWYNAFGDGHYVDMYSRLCRRLCDESRDEEAQDIKTTRKVDMRRRVDGGMPDHPEERQPPKPVGVMASHSFSSVIELETYVYDKGWL